MPEKYVTWRELDHRIAEQKAAIIEAKLMADKAIAKADSAADKLAAEVIELAKLVAAKDNQTVGITHSWAVVLAAVTMISLVAGIVSMVMAFQK